MKKVLIGILAVVAVAGILFFLLKKSPTIKNFPGEGKTIVAFGDSLTEGVGSTEGNDFVSLLSKQIDTPILNLGVSGDTSAKGLARVDKVIAQDPKVVILLLGGNDFLRRIPKEETFKNIDAIVEKIQNSGAIVILLGIKGGVLSDEYEAYFEKIAKNRGTFYISNVLDGLLGHKEYMSDAIHPNDAGYKKIAERVLPVLKKSIAQ